MKTKSIFMLAAVFSIAIASAQDSQTMDNNRRWRESHPNADRDYRLFTANEFNLDLFGTYTAAEGKFTDLFDTDIRHGIWGGGAGVNYFFLRNVGIGTDASISKYGSGDWKFDHWLGDIYLRLPIGESGISPYLIGSGGRTINPSWEWVYGFGPGLEIRFTHNIGIFTDARFLWNHESTSLNTLNFRAGLRLAF